MTFLALITANVIKIIFPSPVSLKYLYSYQCFQTCTTLAQYRFSVSSRERIHKGLRLQNSTCSLEIKTGIQPSSTCWKLYGQRASNNPNVNHEEINVQTIILCVNSPFVSFSVIVTQLIIFLIYIYAS